MLASSRGLSLRSPSLRPRPRSTRPFTTSCSATSSRTRSVCSRTASRCWARPRWRPSASSAWRSSRTARLTFRCWQAAVGGVAGVLLAGLSTQVVKHVACRARPRLVDGWGVGPPMPPAAPTRLGFFHWPCFGERGYHGFPSGHAATAFAVAAALVGWAPARRRWWILASASGVGASRIVLNAHFLSDVLGGALFGWWAGELGVHLVTRYLAPRWRARSPGRAPRSPAAA